MAELPADAYVFSADEGGRRPLRVDAMTRRFGELAESLGHGYTLYGFRHFVAAQLGAVATTATIRERMGHGSLEVTGGYVHRVSDADREAARHMGELFDGVGDQLGDVAQSTSWRSRHSPTQPRLPTYLGR